jgi:hypothetical protein
MLAQYPLIFSPDNPPSIIQKEDSDGKKVQIIFTIVPKEFKIQRQKILFTIEFVLKQ